jgi:hypothetical protein
LFAFVAPPLILRANSFSKFLSFRVERLQKYISILALSKHFFRASTHEEIMEQVDFYSTTSNEYFFDRHPRDDRSS